MNEAAIKSLVLDVVLKSAVRSILAAVPFLNWPVINPLVAYIIMKIATIVYDQMALVVNFTIIDFKTDQEQKAYSKAVEELKAVHAKPDATKEEQENAKQKFKTTLGDLIRFRP